MRWGGSLNNFSVVPTGAAPICASSLANACDNPCFAFRAAEFWLLSKPLRRTVGVTLVLLVKAEQWSISMSNKSRSVLPALLSYVKYPDVQWRWWLCVQNFPPYCPGKESFVFPVHPKKESRASSIALGYGLKSKAMFSKSHKYDIYISQKIS